LDDILDEVWPPEAAPPATEPAGEPVPQPAGGDGAGKAPGLPAEAGPGSEPSRQDRDRADRRARRQTGRRELTARHEAFLQVSPEVGELDEAAFSDLMGEEPDAAAALLADLAIATDRELRTAARRLATRVFVSVGRAGVPRAR